uniref:HAT C-terminal dimerisation domain-containing protein n=1 Tax=Amphimedon queenslandica TaxID=400682 RepID=A0A1X7UFM9_AMPQE
MDYRCIWWRLYHSPNTSDWSNILQLAHLLFTLPVPNGKLERIFSTLKLIKVDRRSSLGNSVLDDLLALNTDPISLKNFNPDHSIQLWWNDKVRRPNQRPRKKYAERANKTHQEDSSEESETDSELLQEWDDWLDD